MAPGNWVGTAQGMGIAGWAAISALVLVLSAWFVLLRPAFRILFPPDKTLSSGAPAGSSPWAFLILLILRCLRRVRFLGFVVSLMMLAAALRTSHPVLFSLAGAFTALVSLPPATNRKTALFGVLFLWLSAVTLVTGSFSNQLERYLGSVLDIRPGLTVTRFRNTEFKPPAEVSGSVWTVDLEKEKDDLLKGDYFSLVFEGYLFIRRSGEYIFNLSSDDGSALYIDDEEVVVNPGYHAVREVSKTVFLESGRHSLKLTYFNGTADARLLLEWTPPGRGTRVVPATCLFRSPPSPWRLNMFRWCSTFLTDWLRILFLAAGALLLYRAYGACLPAGAPDSVSGRRGVFLFLLSRPGRHDVSGWLYGIALGAVAAGLYLVTYYAQVMAPAPHGLRGRMYATPGFERLTDTFDGRNARFHSLTHHELRRSVFGAVFDGYLFVERAGESRFTMRADNGARMYLDGRLEADSWRGNPRKAEEVRCFLDKGLHSVRIEMFNRNLPAFIDVKWRPAGAYLTCPIPLANLYSRRPDSRLLQKDRRFQARVYAVRVVLWIAVVLGVLWPWVRGRGALSPGSVYPAALSVAACVFLWQVSWMRPEHRYGFGWFSDASFPVRVLLSAVIAAAGWRPVLRRLAGIPGICAKHGVARWWVFVIALAAGITGQLVFSGVLDLPPVWGAVFYIVAGFSVFLNRDMYPPRRDHVPSAHAETVSLKWFLFVVITLAAVFVRFYRLHEMPPGLWWDEAQTGWVARDILAGHRPPVYDLRINAGTAASYLVAGWFKLFGSSVYALRSYTASIGVVTVWASYFFFTRFVAGWWPFFGMALVALSRWLFSINRVSMATIDETILVAFLVFLFYADAVRKRRRRDAVITGILLGLGLHLHTGARVLPLIVGADMVVRFLREGRGYLRKHGINAAVIILSAVVVFAPMGAFILEHRDAYFKRSKQTLLATEYPGWYPVPILMDNVVNYLKMYPYSGDWHPRHNTGRKPQLPPAVAVLALYGFALAVARFREHEQRLFVLGFLLVTLQGVLTVHNGTANLNRVAENIPIVYLWAVTGAIFVFAALRQAGGKKCYRIALAGLPVMVVIASGATAMRIYFHDHLRDHAIVGDYGFQPELTECAAYVRRLIRENPRLHVWAEYIRSDSFRYIFGGHPRLHDLAGGRLPPAPGNHPIAVVVQRKSKALERKVRNRFPEASVVDVPYSLDREYTLFKVFFIPPSEPPGGSAEKKWKINVHPLCEGDKLLPGRRKKSAGEGS